ncbi:NCS2 family permease [Tenuibacillus multivorans]|uniref:Putative MFS transporter, AGZA family, xanthine/uracil permease n=1 Tax=Tenuibacillus multivorans TaxID=237069 RepID=A0A1G9Y257_9BACI|nr:NCS2 family permease [Tenuibacillus multivorans]GEL75917.1 permease [Tenuibacillus multivorans]SDN03138.1 putative MFS transporter, AGZA family, xanthine/uracil permease [Tenuibacillus multivorans]
MKQLNKKDWSSEILAGIIGYLTTVYIVAVNSSILAEAGIDREQAMIATILASFVGSVLIGLWAKVPIVIIPGMGVNVLFTFSIVQQYNFTYEEGLGIVVVSSIIFLLTAFTPIGEKFKIAVPDSLKHGITIGLGLFLVLIGLENGGLIVSGEYSIITLGDFASPTVLVSLLSLIIGIVLFVKNVPANFLLTMIIGTWLASMFGILDQEKGSSLSLDGWSSLWVMPDFSHIGSIFFWIAVLPLSIVLIFESMGLIHGQLSMINKSDSYKSANRSSALSALLSGFFGTSPTIPAAESAAVIASKGSTGIASIVTGILFLTTFLFIPYISLIPTSAISPILIIVGVLMMQNIKHIQIDDLTEAFPTFLIMFMIPFTYSIADGMAFGFIAYPIIKIVTRQKEKLSPLLILISSLFLIEFIIKALM